MKAGTRIEVQGWTFDLSHKTWESARIGRRLKFMLPIPEGFHPVTFTDGGRLLVHESNFRVVDNGPQS